MIAPLYGYIFAGALLAAVLSGISGYSFGSRHAAAAAEVQMAEHLAADKTAEIKATEDAHDQEQKLAALQNAVSEAYEQGKRNAEIKSKRVVDDIRAGDLRMQQYWAGCAPNNLPGATPSSVQLDAETGNRAESASRIVRAAAECDSQITGLQDLLKSERTPTK